MALRPMLAATVEDFDQIVFPVIGSPKLDGIRCLMGPVSAQSRSLKNIPNQYVQDKLTNVRALGLDGELIVGDPTNPLCYTITSSGIMSVGGTPDFTYFVFDRHLLATREKNYIERMQHVDWDLQNVINDRVKVLPILYLWDRDELETYEAEMVEMGFEGIMIRSDEGPYKYGRSSMREQYLCKIKRFEDTEAEVVGFQEKYTNENAPTINVLGYQERSGHLANLIPQDTLGSLILKHPEFDDTFQCGSGFTDETRREAWAGRFDSLIGRTAKIKYQKSGVKDKPRFPIFLGWRYPE